MLPSSRLMLSMTAFLIHTATAAPAKSSNSRSQPNPVWARLIGSWNSNSDMRKFLLDAYVKMGPIDCTVVVWDEYFGNMMDSLTFCHPTLPQCAHKYVIKYEGGNMSAPLVDTLRAGYQEQCGGYIILLSKTNAVTHLLHKGDDSRMVNTRARFLIWYGTSDKGFEADEIWKKIPNVILFRSKAKRRNAKGMTFTILKMMWPVIPGARETIRILEFWRRGKLSKNDNNWFYDKTSDLKNATVRILVVEHPPGVIKYVSPDETTVQYAGTEVEIVKELSNIMNFNFELVDADTDSKWGGQATRNGTRKFYGAVARLIYGETDMAIGSFFILKHYLEFLDMSVPLDVACTSFLTPNPLPRPRYLALLLPFRMYLWVLAMSVCFVFVPTALYLLTKAPQFLTEYRAFSGRINVVFSSLSIMSQVALHVWPKFWPVRMFIGWYWLYCLLVSLVYRGAMVSFLTIPLYEKPIDNLNDLASSNLRLGGWGVELRRLFTEHQGKTSFDKTQSSQSLANRYEVIDDVNEGIDMVAKGDFALYENIRFLKFVKLTRNLTKLGSPSMRLMKQCIVPVHIGIAYQKNSPITTTINRHIRRFQESGLIKRWSQRLVSTTKAHYKHIATQEFEEGDGSDNADEDHKEDDEEQDEEFANGGGSGSSKQQRKQRVLSIKDLQGSIYFILFGVFLSIGTFLAEILITHSKNAALNVEKELMKIVDKSTKDKTANMNLINEIIPTIVNDNKRFKIKLNVNRRLQKLKAKLKRKRTAKAKIVLYPYIE